ncbi:hypothetical protein RUM44_002383 [Polyplax serrata]|uniref:Uncharacterized protein n=1 Tax=Polyplax serrata TaxID=468196 RepID=A0ABR1AD59_POLSC
MSQQPMVVLSTSDSDDDDSTTSKAAFRHLSEKVLEMAAPRRPRGRPRKENGGGRSPEEDPTWRAKRQKIQRAASEIETEATVEEALRGLRADACSSATLEELRTMVCAATKAVVKVATASQNLKGTFVKALKDAAKLCRAAAEEMAVRIGADEESSMREELREAHSRLRPCGRKWRQE